MKMIFFVAFLSLNVLTVHGMDGKLISKNEVSEELKQARQLLEEVCNTQDPALDNHLRNGMRAVKRALKSKHEGFEDELASMQAFIQGMQDFHQEKDPDQILSHVVDVIYRPHATDLLRRMRSRSFGIVIALADEKKHTISNFFWIKQLLNSEPDEFITEGLDRFDRFFAQNVQEKNYEDLSELFRYSQILEDIKNLAEASANTHAQCTMAKYHLFLAKSGKEMDGAPVDPRDQLKKAQGYAEQAVAACHETSVCLLQEIQARLQEYELPTDLEGAEESALLSKSVLEQKKKPQDTVMQLIVPPLQKVAPLKMLCAFELIKSGAGRQGLYFMGKKMTEHSEHIFDLGVNCLQESAKLGNPFALERLGDTFFDADPQRAFVLYAQALQIFNTRGSIYTLTGCFGKKQFIESKMEKLAQKSVGITTYQEALRHGKNAVFEQEIYEISDFKLHVDQLVGITFSHENFFVKNMHSVDTSHLELLQTTGVLAYMEHFRSDRGIQNVLITALTLRAHVGRGFILKEKTILAHYKKALQFILDPKTACTDSLDAPVSDELLLKKIMIDQLPVQHRILYIESMLGVLEQRIAHSELTQEDALYACQLFLLVDAALHETKDMNLRSLHTPKCAALLKELKKVASRSRSGEHVYQLALRFIEQQEMQEAYDLMTEAEELFTTYYQTEQRTSSQYKKQMAHIKNVRALVLWQREQIDEAYALFQESLRYNPDDIAARWDFGHRLVRSGDPLWRKEGLVLIEQLASTGKHRKSLEFMASCYGGEKTHLMSRNIDKAIVCMQQLIKDDPKEYFVHRLKLAVLYKAKASSVQNHERRLLLTKALDLLNPYKLFRADVHMQYIDILAFLEKNQEILQAMTQYVVAKEVSVKDILELAECYNKHAHDANLKLKIRNKLRDRSEALLRSISEKNDEAYYKLIELLLRGDKFQEVNHQLSQDKGQHMVCLQEALKACTLLEEHGLKKIDDVLWHAERAFEVYQTFFGRFQNDEGACALINLLTSLKEGSAAHITHPMKSSSLSQIAKLLDMINLLIIKGECSDDERCRVLAYYGYLNVKLSLEWLKTEPGVTYDNVIAVLKKAIEAVQKTNDLPCKEKLLNLIQLQTEFWHNEEQAKACLRAQMITQLVVLAVSVCKGTDAAIINNLLYASVVQAKSFVEKLDTSTSSAEEKAKINQQQLLLAHILEKNCIKK